MTTPILVEVKSIAGVPPSMLQAGISGNEIFLKLES